ncbi:hypothetical protein [Polaromonas sp.]|uniref:hypothetical protein n=1 Tax=Polaromonas sp. TaxID=1869339 RepID=UPI0025EA54B0|nr:hypothetical protein [Polaromonas sp.]
MNPVGADQLQHITVLRKKGYGIHRPARQHTFEVFRQCKAGPLYPGSSILAAVFRLLQKLLYCGLHGPKYQRRAWQSDHLQCAHCLVQLLARNSQLPGVKRSQIGAARCLCLPHKTLERLCCALQRFTKLVKHPSQGAKIIDAGVEFMSR